jgi:hypothetical protein
MPDWPILRHLTWREAHLFELGIWPGIGVGLAVHGEFYMIAVALIVAIRYRMQDMSQRENSEDLIRGYVRDAWYFGMGALLAYVLTWVML